MKYNDPGSFLTIGHLNPDRCVDMIEYTSNVRFRLHSDIYLIVGTYCRNGIIFLFGVTFQDVSGPNKNIELSLVDYPMCAIKVTHNLSFPADLE